MDKLPKYIALLIIAFSCLFSVQQFYMGLNETESLDSIYNLWLFVFVILIAYWCDKDSVGKNWPFEFSFFVYLFWPVALPYYLFKTRGVDGLIMFIGFTALYVTPNIMWLIGYQYS